jgi:uncharacterized protein (DUF2141 family)
MAYISVSGTGFAARTLALATFAMMNVAATQVSSLDVGVTGLRSTKGLIRVCLTANPKAFPDCSKDPAAHTMSVAATQAGRISMQGLAPATYAVSLIHDENGNAKLDTKMGIPAEGVGFSRNPRLMFGAPTFSSASFVVEGGVAVTQSVKMKYFL